MKLLVVLCCLLAVINAATVTPFTACGNNCGVAGVDFTNSTTYLMLTNDGTVWRSGDEGQNWLRVLPGMQYFELSPADSQYVIFLNAGSRVTAATAYVSTDGGATIQRILPPVSYISGITMHPSNPSWLMVYECSSTCNVVYSKDFGTTWASGLTGLAVQLILWGHDPSMPDIVFAVRSDNSFGYTNNYGGSWTKLFDRCLGWVLTDYYLYVGVSVSSSANLYSSSSRVDPSHTNKQNYWLDEFPSGNSLPESGYTFLDDASRSEFIAVKQQGAGNGLWGTIYSSDFDGDQFAMSLPYAAQTDLTYDFDIFNGLSGIYVANAYPSGNSNTKQTFFTFDNGGDWNKLVAPKTDYLGIPTNCSLSSGCSLHLHGLTSWYKGVFPPFYSSPNAVGLMIAVGNMGTSLATDTANSQTYFTRNAGITWTVLYNKPTIYEFGDHGGILVYAPISTPTTFVYYSLDEGLTSQMATFSTTAMYVDKPQGTGQKFVLLGHTGSSVNIKYYIFGLDFSGLNLPVCTDSDYENWSPSNDDNVNSNCFMGEQLIYRRRKQDSQCYNPDMDHIVQPRVPCACGWEDFECDVGFIASARNGTDYFTCTAIHNVPSCATGYRLIPDTNCTGGIDLGSVDCPGYSGRPTTTITSSTSSTGPQTIGPQTIGSTTTTTTRTTTTTSTAQPTVSSPTEAPATTTGGHKEESHTGSVVAIVLVFIILFGGAGGVGFMYYKNENFRAWVLSKLQRGPAQGYGRVNTDDNDEEGGN